MQRALMKQAPLVWLALSCLLTGIAGADDSLYIRIGGLPMLQKITGRLTDIASTDAVTKRSFKQTNLDRIKEKLAEQFCVLAGGPCRYSGDDMALVHQGLNISEREFYGLVEQLRDILDEEGIDSREKNELLALLAPMKPQIVHPVIATP